MKLEPVFTVKENKLYKIADNSLVDPASLKRVEIPWSTVEMEDETYNEEFLALLRDQLKTQDAIGNYVVLVPVVDKPLQSADKEELFINAYNHTARRVKDCVCVAGFELPAELKDKEGFMETLAIKHAQYVYFTKQENPPSENIVKY